MKTVGTSNQKSICKNCTNKGLCVFEKIAESPIYSCDSYEFSVSEKRKQKSKTKKNRKSVSLYKWGVCSNCINVKTCIIRTEDEVKIQCEQYG